MGDMNDKPAAPGTTRQRRLGNPRFAALQARVDAGKGLLAHEWDWWDATFKALDPEDYTAYRGKIRHDRILDDARKNLSADDLRTLLAEKELANG